MNFLNYIVVKVKFYMYQQQIMGWPLIERLLDIIDILSFIKNEVTFLCQ